ncbi:MAG: hypothetical protein QNJ29_05345 [Rhizobiaceae bacterium]|nr:hypothetical protein [Rhizobiaceae bacterium]
MHAQKKMTDDESQVAPISEQDVLQQILSGPKDAVAIGEGLPEMQRARVAQFCYNRVHMREMGLRLAASCSLMSLKAAFGRAGEVVYKQSRDVDQTLGELKNSPGNQAPKPITLKTTIAG